MATVYIIAAEADTVFLERQVLPVLPCNGYSHWLSGFHLTGDAGDITIARAMNQCQAIIIVISKSLLKSPVVREEIDIAFSSKRMNIMFQIETLADRNILPERLWALPLIDLTVEKQTDAEELLVNLLPTATADIETNIPDYAERIRWNEEIFSRGLKHATARHDHARARWLISMLNYHVANLSTGYPAARASADMQALRQEREFRLMLSYGDAVIRSGTKQDKFLRLLAQALIETKRYDTAMEVLDSILKDPDSSPTEILEARGLIGRIYKQQYVNNPSAGESASLLRSAIAAYVTVYLEDRRNFWHGVNAVSCTLRLQRDGIYGEGLFIQPLGIAEQIVRDLDQLSEKGPLEVWDCASKVEALVALERYEEAEQALEVYVHHPAMTAFEVFSTYRQFDQVLQLGENPEGAEILASLRNTMERYRAGTVLTSPASTPKPGQGIKDNEGDLKALIIRLSDPSWNPEDIPGLTIQSRLGKIVTVRGSNETVRQLLEDPMVISIEESRPATGMSECDRSLPFIKIAGQYPSSAGNYAETGALALIAIIDDSIDVLHKAFLDVNGNSRIAGVWDQTDNNGNPPKDFNYGTFHSRAAIAGYIQTQSVPLNLGRNGQLHGTHVASIAVGRAVGLFAGGVAPDAQLLVVIPNINENGYPSSYGEALDFIDKFAEELKLPVVVNVSQGMNAGAHDGKSSLEVAFDAFTKSGSAAGRVVVKSAGNERDKGTHAKVTMANGALDKLCWRRLPGADSTERIELWWSSADEVKFRLGEAVPAVQKPQQTQTPSNLSNWVETKAPKCSGMFPNGGPYQLDYTKRHISNGDSLLEIKLGKDITNPAGLGEWVLEINGLDIKESGEIHCWIERGQGGMPASFQLPHVNEEMTLSIPGTAYSVITVAAIDASMPLQTYDSSSWGPTRDGRRNKPLICAPGVNIHAAEAGTDSGIFSDSGTSMAAPHVAGAIALVLSRGVRLNKEYSANQIAAVIRQKTLIYNMNWDRGQGFGVIDVSALLAAFE